MMICPGHKRNEPLVHIYVSDEFTPSYLLSFRHFAHFSGAMRSIRCLALNPAPCSQSGALRSVRCLALNPVPCSQSGALRSIRRHALHPDALLHLALHPDALHHGVLLPHVLLTRRVYNIFSGDYTVTGAK